MEELIKLLILKRKTIATMESCTGGYLANCITNVKGAGKVFQFSAITYSNEFKIKMGIKKEVIDQYGVYSIQTADCMSLAISQYAHSNYGIGITGKLDCFDKNHHNQDDCMIFISIYNKDTKKFYHRVIKAMNVGREFNKQYVINQTLDMLKEIL